MKPIFNLVAIATLLSSTQGLLIPGLGPFWNNLKTTWNPDGLIDFLPGYEANGYNPVPRTLSAAEKEGWKRISTSCENGGLFNGFRYVEKNNRTHYDFGASALYDKNGFIAGIQMNIPVSYVNAQKAQNTYKIDKLPAFVKNTIPGEGEFYSLTAYFVEPASICSKGRSPAEFRSQGTGNLLAFQNGTSPQNLVVAPMERKEALEKGWSDNKCFIGMGLHNAWHSEQFQLHNCDDMFPVFLLYTKTSKKLLGFGFYAFGTFPGGRFEHPPPQVSKMMFGNDDPPCFSQKIKSVGMSSMHVFLIGDAIAQNCII